MAVFKVPAYDANGKPYWLNIANDADAEFVAAGLTLTARTDVSDWDGPLGWPTAS
jgi:hypothetical protein